ncbi:microviridin/marinostatin family tricyclic proteinase inhibitor [Flavobacterium sp.]|uniref:microviridin/marinostatin family tricyclic proteinase inhibitor n=1 Tax=Flavobacterium sp. TaxID=239 RepID=UPI003D6AC715
MKNKENLKKPFFANFLENQISKEEQTTIQGSAPMQTLKYPSDGEDGPGNITKPAVDIAHTMKYPSDNDEAGTEI